MQWSEQNKRTVGASGEMLADAWYQERGRQIKEHNWTIQGGEIDLIVENDEFLVCVEVKVVRYLEDIHDYLTPRKLWFLRRSFDTYLWKHPTSKQVRIDVVFVKQNSVWEVYENVTW